MKAVTTSALHLQPNAPTPGRVRKLSASCAELRHLHLINRAVEKTHRRGFTNSNGFKNIWEASPEIRPINV